MDFFKSWWIVIDNNTRILCLPGKRAAVQWDPLILYPKLTNGRSFRHHSSQMHFGKSAHTVRRSFGDT